MQKTTDCLDKLHKQQLGWHGMKRMMHGLITMIVDMLGRVE